MSRRQNRRKLSLPTRKSARRGFGIVEVMVSIVVLGFMYVALSKLQLGNHDAFLRIRGRDGAVEVAQQVMDYLKTVGVAAIPSDQNSITTIPGDGSVLAGIKPYSRSWARGLGGDVTVTYTPTVTVQPTKDYEATNASSYETVTHIYAKQVNVKIDWAFKGTTQSINVSGVIR